MALSTDEEISAGESVFIAGVDGYEIKGFMSGFTPLDNSEAGAGMRVFAFRGESEAARRMAIQSVEWLQQALAGKREIAPTLSAIGALQMVEATLFERPDGALGAGLESGDEFGPVEVLDTPRAAARKRPCSRP